VPVRFSVPLEPAWGVAWSVAQQWRRPL